MSSFLKQPQNKITFLKEINKNRIFYIMTLPGVLFLLVFNYLPMIGVVMAFQSYNPVKGIFGSKFIGLKNFEFFFKSEAAWTVTFNTVFYNVLYIVSITIFSVLFAIMLNELGKRSLSGLYKTVMLMPYFLSWIVAEYILYALLSENSGMVNDVLNNLNMESVRWYGKPDVWRAILPMAYIWKTVGYITVLYLAAISGISTEYYEAAQIDGASKLQQIRYITIPMLTPVMITLMLLWGGKIFNGGVGDWGAFWNLPRESGVLYSTTNVIDTHVFRALRTVNDLGMASAVGFYQSIVGFVLILSSNFLVKKYDRESSLF